jgi:hypothetical protein
VSNIPVVGGLLGKKETSRRVELLGARGGNS